MRISSDIKQLLARIELASDLPATDVAEQLGWPEYKARRIIRRLREQHFITERAFINPQRLGIYEQAIFFSMASRYSGAREDMLRALGASTKVNWLGAFAGHFDVGMTISMKTPFEAAELFDDVTKRFCKALYNKSFATRIGIHFFGRRYLDVTHEPTRPLGYDGRLENEDVSRELDMTDYTILTGLSVRHYRSHRQLAMALDVPLSTFNYRLEKLKDLGVVKGFFYIVNSFKLGMRSYKLLVRTSACDQKLRKAFFAYVEKHPHIVSLFHSLGHWDYEMEVEIKQDENISVVTQELHDSFPEFIGEIIALHSLNVEQQIVKK